MKELVSFRHWFMMDQTQLLSTIKERTCFLSLDLERDLRVSKCVSPGATAEGLAGTRDRASSRENDNICRYVLPDFVGDNKSLGYVLDAADERPAADFGNQQVLSLNNERFTVPEALFKPSLVGMASGIATLPENDAAAQG
jgi:actin-related protein 6